MVSPALVVTDNVRPREKEVREHADAGETRTGALGGEDVKEPVRDVNEEGSPPTYASEGERGEKTGGGTEERGAVDMV